MNAAEVFEAFLFMVVVYLISGLLAAGLVCVQCCWPMLRDWWQRRRP